MFFKKGENSFAEYWASPHVENKSVTIRKSKSGSPLICLTCVDDDCKHIDWFKKQMKTTPNPWDTPEGVTIAGPG